MAPSTDKTRAMYMALSEAEDKQDLRETELEALESEERAARASLEELLVKKSSALKEVQAGEFELEKLREEIEATMQRPESVVRDPVPTNAPPPKKQGESVPTSDRQLRSRVQKPLQSKTSSAAIIADKTKKPSIRIRLVNKNPRKRSDEADSISGPIAKKPKRGNPEAVHEEVANLALEAQEQYLEADKTEWLTKADSTAGEMGLLGNRIPFGTPVDGATVTRTLSKADMRVLKSSTLQSTERVMRLP